MSFEGKFEGGDVALVEGVVDGLALPARVDLPRANVLRELGDDVAKLLGVANGGKEGGAMGVEVADGGVEALAVGGADGGLVEGGAEGVQGDVDGVGVGAGAEDLWSWCVCVCLFYFFVGGCVSVGRSVLFLVCVLGCCCCFIPRRSPWGALLAAISATGVNS